MAVIFKNIWVLWTCDNKAEVHWVLTLRAWCNWSSSRRAFLLYLCHTMGFFLDPNHGSWPIRSGNSFFSLEGSFYLLSYKCPREANQVVDQLAKDGVA